ncbi:hypothetical protein PIROE2DRAFT_15530 [Piromyces sp. E2]|nr:hypothetical protein PIROE2DRAFT_15530 [Piromyces sp. E2]|eukprot:OUM59043.1 hypothetical protein PIROE2DRAFT_15530 [Piromyces sp. E2]
MLVLNFFSKGLHICDNSGYVPGIPECAVGFGFIAINQIKYQPFYSSAINNYRFGIYFSYCISSILSILVLTTTLSNSQFISDIAPFILIILFGIGYKINNIYYKLCIKRIYKKLQEKEKVTNLRKTVSNDELKYNPSKLKKKNVYKSVERIST